MVARDCAADLPRAVPHDLRVVPDVAPVPGPGDVRKLAFLEVAFFGSKSLDHVARGILARSTHPEVFARTLAFIIGRMAHAALPREDMRPLLRLTRQLLAPFQLSRAKMRAFLIMDLKQLGSEAVLNRSLSRRGGTSRHSRKRDSEHRKYATPSHGPPALIPSPNLTPKKLVNRQMTRSFDERLRPQWTIRFTNAANGRIGI